MGPAYPKVPRWAARAYTHEAAAFGCPGARGAGASRGGEKIVKWVLPFTNLPHAACDFDWKYLERGSGKEWLFGHFFEAWRRGSKVGLA